MRLARRGGSLNGRRASVGSAVALSAWLRSRTGGLPFASVGFGGRTGCAVRTSVAGATSVRAGGKARAPVLRAMPRGGYTFFAGSSRTDLLRRGRWGVVDSSTTGAAALASMRAAASTGLRSGARGLSATGFGITRAASAASRAFCAAARVAIVSCRLARCATVGFGALKPLRTGLRPLLAASPLSAGVVLTGSFRVGRAGTRVMAAAFG